MATFTDITVGSGLIVLAIAIFFYYSIWVLVLPFVDPSHFLRSYFLSLEYAIALPLGAVVVLVAFIGIFVAVVLIKDSARKAKKKT
ncbi:hypothetical protein EMCRGX_G021089 [Ephydatia muelleri]